jgi:hypothetical protein
MALTLPALDDPRVPSLAALLVALLLLASPFVLYPQVGQAEYDHSIERIDQREIPGEADVRQYEDLSPEAQGAVDRSLADPDGSATVYGEANEPPEFFYSDYTDYGRGIYVIQKDGTYYRLTTYAGGGLLPTGLITAAALALTGVAVGAAGVAGWGRERTRTPLVFAGGGLAVLAAAVASFSPAGPFGAADLFVPLLAVPVAWLAVGATHDGETTLTGAVVAVVAVTGAVLVGGRGGPTIPLVLGLVGALAAGVGGAGRWAARR